VSGIPIRWMVGGAMASRRAMINNTILNTRVLKVSETGDFYRKHTWPYLRLMGLWLLRAGIYPNSHVRIENPRPGVLVIQVQDEVT
jgi:hypothetical protein